MRELDGVTLPIAASGDDERVSGRLLRKNLSVVSLTYLVSGVFGIAAQVVLARHLGRATMGVFFAAFSLVTIVQVLDRLAREEYVVREGARNHRRLETLVGEVLALKAVTGVLVVGISGAVAVALGLPRQGVVVAVLLAVMAGASAAGDAFRSGLQAIERLEIASAISVVNAVVSSIGMIVIVLLGGGLIAAVGFSTVVTIVSVPAAWLALRTRIHVRLRATGRTLLRLAKESFPFTAAGVLTVAAGYVDTLVVQGTLGDHATGLYGAAYRIIVVVGWLPAIFQTATYRSISYLAHKARAEFGPFVERSAAAMCVLGLPIAAGGAVVGGRLLTLVFGPQFAAGADAFRALIWSIPFAFPAVVLMTAVVVDERPQAAAWIFGWALGLNLTANLILVPRYGIVAAAWATVATEAFVAVVGTVILARRGVRPGWPILAAPAAVAAGVMAAVVFALRHFPLPVPVAVGAVVYGVLLLAFGVPRRLGLPLRRRGARAAA